jgi:Cu-processing system ATP-binding protein
MIDIQGVCKTFGRQQVLTDVDLTFTKGKSLSLIGPNGSGKTTLIKILLGMVKPDRGTISFNGKIIAKQWAYRSTIGYMPQIGRYPHNMTIDQLFRMMKDIRNDHNSATDYELFESFGLDQIAQKRMRTLSGGTTQKVSASIAFLFSPQVLILDEPTSGLDPLSTEILKNKIKQEKKNGKLILITSHILSDLDDIVQDIVYLQEGRIKFFKSLDQLKEETGEKNLSKAIASFMRSEQKTF